MTAMQATPILGQIRILSQSSWASIDMPGVLNAIDNDLQ
jgi:hypothetical protein